MPKKLTAVATTTRLARLVREPVRFWLRVASRSKTVGRYHLRGSDEVIYLRHGTVDILTLDQIVGAGHYDIPPPAAAALSAARAPIRVVDLGANVGLFGAYVRRLYPHAEISAFEPHPANVEVLRRSIDANGDGWHLIAACADVSDGIVPLWIGGEYTTSRIEASTGAGIDVPALDVFPYLEDVDLLKIDIEGAEWRILDDPRFDSVRARVVALEYHAHECPDPDPGAYARRRLEGAGYETAESGFDPGPGYGLVWGWRFSEGGSS